MPRLFRYLFSLITRPVDAPLRDPIRLLPVQRACHCGQSHDCSETFDELVLRLAAENKGVTPLFSQD